MSGSTLEFRITATDQASAALTSVQKKVMDFGKDIGKGIVGAIGPMAAVGYAVSKVTEYLDDMAKKAKEAFDWGSTLSDNAAKLGVTVEEFQRITNAAEATGQSVDKVGQAFKLAADIIAQAKAGNQDAIASLAALGISVQDLGNAKPEDVLAKLSAAMAAATNPTDKMAIAMAALGKSAKDLQNVLAKGFDIQGAMLDMEGLTQEEADLLRDTAKKERAKANKEKVEAAREAARKEFMNTPEGQEFARRNTKYYGAGYGTAVVGPTNEQIDAELARVRKQKRTEAAAAAAAANPPNPVAAGALLKIAAENAAKEAAKETAKPKQSKGAKIGGVSNEAIENIKTPPITVSSLREIGGGIAGEGIANTTDLMVQQVNLQEKMLKELEVLNTKSRDNTDFTKPLPNGMRISSGIMLA